ncbi:putative colicin V production protein [Alkalibacterium sp. AK22]|uniref:CvpA family protein n=1 Tax=Alkalibacterium sp. AK22 TaxID=1229520 RepID=UPI00044ED2FC|nr:CvpA family protein [Alkalibacterium sp. AK22]EXJ23167.1 putative colicin V production protein [Alkalibacterium sp. AK22]
MVLTLIIFFILLLSLYSGARRGLILQLVLTIGYSVSFWAALTYHRQVSEWAEMLIPYPTPTSSSTNPFVLYSMDFLFEMDGAFYRGISFVLILFAGWLITRLVGGLFNFMADIPVVRTINAIGGALLSFVVHYIGLFLVLFVLSTVPLPFIQDQLASSNAARNIITTTPELSGQFYEWWIVEGIQD